MTRLIPNWRVVVVVMTLFGLLIALPACNQQQPPPPTSVDQSQQTAALEARIKALEKEGNELRQQLSSQGASTKTAQSSSNQPVPAPPARDTQRTVTKEPICPKLDGLIRRFAIAEMSLGKKEKSGKVHDITTELASALDEIREAKRRQPRWDEDLNALEKGVIDFIASINDRSSAGTEAQTNAVRLIRNSCR